MKISGVVLNFSNPLHRQCSLLHDGVCDVTPACCVNNPARSGLPLLAADYRCNSCAADALPTQWAGNDTPEARALGGTWVAYTFPQARPSPSATRRPRGRVEGGLGLPAGRRHPVHWHLPRGARPQPPISRGVGGRLWTLRHRRPRIASARV